MLNPTDALVLMIDVQKNHYPLVYDGDATLKRLVAFLSSAKILDIPIVWSEHYPKAFGPTLPEVTSVLSGITPITKKSFSCFGEPTFVSQVEAVNRSTLYLTGSETHICIMQTGLEALEQGMSVVAVADCLTGRHFLDHQIALSRLQNAGAIITTWEAVVYEWMRTANHPSFKKVLSLVKGK